MKSFTAVQGSQTTVPTVEVNVDTVYVRSNIVAVSTDDFKGWQYDEIQYGKDEYITLKSEQTETLRSQAADTLLALATGGIM